MHPYGFPGLRSRARATSLRLAPLLVLAAACTRNLELPPKKPPTAPNVALTSISPATLRLGAVATIAFQGNAPSTSCWASVGGQVADCTFTPPSSCACTFTVAETTPEGLLQVYAIMGNEVGNGLAFGFVVIDKTAPTLDPGAVTVTRRACGVDDAVAGAAAATSDGGVAYANRRVVAVRIWGAASGGSPLLTLAPAADGSFAQADVPATGGGLVSPAPATYHASALDVAGNESERVPIASGALTAPPAISDLLSVVVDRSAGTGGVRGEAGAIGPVATLCGARPVASDGSTGLGPIFSPAPDGSFAEVALSAGEPGTVYLSAWDKAANVAGPTRVRSVDAVTSPGGRAAYSPDLGAALFARAAGAPTATAPGPGPLLAGEVSDLRAAEAAAVDGASFLVTAASETATAAEWVRTEKQPASGGFAAYDPVRQRTVLLAQNGTFESDGTGWTWRAFLPFGSPTPVAYLAASGGIVTIEGGVTRKWNGTAWSNVATAAAPTSAGRIATDAARNRVVFHDGSLVTWEFDAAVWTSVSTAAYPTPQVTQPILAYDASRGQVVLYGGYSGTWRTETWAWNGTRWTQIVTATTPGTCGWGGAAYHAGMGRLVLVGGPDAAGSCGASPAGWRLDASSWVELAGTVGPPYVPGSYGAGVAYDAARGKLLSAGRDTWALGTTWQEQAPRLPSAIRATMAYDPRRAAPTYLDGKATWTAGAGGWSRGAQGASPDAVSLLYDADRGGLVALERIPGGYRGWRQQGSTWTVDPALGAGLPADATLQFAADPVRGRLVATGFTSAATYEHDGSAWSLAGAAPWIVGGQDILPLVFFDPARGRVVASGGTWYDIIEDTGGEVPDVWEWNGGAWGLRASDNLHNVLSTATFDPGVAPTGMTISGYSFGATVAFDGTRWSALGGVSGLAATSALAHDAPRGVSVGLADREASELRVRRPHARSAAVEGRFRLPPEATVVSASARLVGAGRGASAGVATRGVRLLAWSFSSWSWTSLGTHAAAETDAAAARTIAASLDPAQHVRDGRVWLLAAPLHASSASPAIPSELWIDALEVSARYTLP